MIIESKILENFIDKASVGGKIDEIRLDFGKLGLTMIEFDKAQLFMSKCTLNKTAFKTFDEIGEIAINNVTRFKSFLKRFNCEISLEKDGVVLKIKGKTKNAEYILASVESMSPKRDFPKYEDFKVSINIDSKTMKDVLNDSSTVGKDVDINFVSGDKCLIVSTGKDDKFTETIPNNAITEKGVETRFGEPLKDVITVLQDNIIMSYGHKGPMKIVEKKEMEEYMYFIAPKVDVEDE